MPLRPVTERAFAKVNLCLHVTGQRADGYHLLDSIVAFAGIGDVLTAAPAGVSSLTLEGPFGADLPKGGENSVLKAARALAPGCPAAFCLEKHLPPASGIGGGTADAAAAIRAALRLQGRAEGAGLLAGLDVAGLQALGADVPVCLLSHPARMRGIGERLDLIDHFPGGAILLANPRVEVPTPAVFRALTRKDNAPLPDRLPDWPDITDLARWLAQQRNDLQTPALQHAPVIDKVLTALTGLPGALISRMSGSGATCFALFQTQDAADAAAADLRARHPGWWVAAGPLYPGDPGFASAARRLMRVS